MIINNVGYDVGYDRKEDSETSKAQQQKCGNVNNANTDDGDAQYRQPKRTREQVVNNMYI